MIKIEKKIKGYAVIKPGSTPTAPESAPNGFVNDADRRLAISSVPTPVLGSLRWEKRPVLPAGNPGMTYMLDKCPEGKFAVFVGHIVNGTPTTGTPFECWALGAEAPRGLAALAMNISFDLRSRDRGYLRKKLESLSKRDGIPFDGQMPDGTHVRFPGAVAAFARLVLYRCEELGAFNQYNGESSVIDAMMSKREPKTTPDGSLAWFCDIKNPATNDDGKIFLCEAELPGGQRRPYSLWLSGQFPAALEGLAVALSLDMQVVEPEWIGRKCRQLLTHSEPQGEFFAQVPGSDKRKVFPSTVAYIAQLVLHRFAQLNLLTENGESIKESGVVQLALIEGGLTKSEVDNNTERKGALCPSCQNFSMVAGSGCPTCVSCGYSRC